MLTFAAAYAMKERMKHTVLKNPKIYGIGVGYKDPRHPRKGAAVILYSDARPAALREKYTALSIKQHKHRTDVPIRIVRTGQFCCHADYRSKIRPVKAGYSIGTSVGSGTLGLIVAKFPKGCQRYMFSNNHVLTNPANEKKRAETLQPGGSDNGRSRKDRVGWIKRFVQLQPKAVNFLDAALSAPVKNSILNPRYATVGALPGHVTSYRVGERFKKVGRTTGFTYGIVDSVHTDIKVSYGNLGVLAFHDQSVIRGNKPVSLPGDSGSVWLRRKDNFAAAVNFAGSGDGKISVAFPVDWAMTVFGTRVARPCGTGCIRTVKAAKGNRAYSRQLTAKERKSIKVICVTA